MENFDYIFTGGGCAALSTAIYLSRLGLGKQRVLIIDQDEKKSNDRTWCYWSKGAHPFPEIVRHSWTQLAFADNAGQLLPNMYGYEYHLVQGQDFYEMAQKELSQNPNIQFLQQKVDHIFEEEAVVKVWAGGQIYSANYVLNSIVRLPSEAIPTGQYLLYQHFMGWWIESEAADFSEKVATLMDFRTPQMGDARFFYVLPVSANRALVEYTIFSDQLLDDQAYRAAIEEYLQGQLGLTDFSITEEEFGVIPMTNIPLSAPSGKRVIAIGTAGGAVKPTTGYAFLRIQEQTQKLALHLLKGVALNSKDTSKRFNFYDDLLLHILQKEGNNAVRIFSALFRNNKLSRILTFLDEKTWIGQELLLFTRLPFAPFLRACFFKWFHSLWSRFKTMRKVVVQ